MSILLINPPFLMPDKPSIGIPQLSSYLAQEGISFNAYDANLHLCKCLLTTANLNECLEYARARLAQLQKKKKPARQNDAREISELKRILNIIDKNNIKIIDVFSENINDITSIFFLFQLFISLATIRFFPEYISFTNNTNNLRFCSDASMFSSKDILNIAADDSHWVPKLLAELIALQIETIKPSLVGLSVTFPDQIFFALQIARLIKNSNPQLHICLGGGFVSCHMRNLNNPGFFKYIDSIVLDDGEVPLVKLYRIVTEGGSEDFSGLFNAIYVDKLQQIIRTPIKEMPKLTKVIPDYSIYNLNEYLVEIKHMALMYRISHGCYWAKCSFCKTELPMIRDYYVYDMDILFERIKRDRIEKGIKIFNFTDDAINHKKIFQFAQMIIDAELDIIWVASIRCEAVFTLESAMLLRESGCRSIYMGVEAYNDRLLKLMSKGINQAQIDKVINNISWAGISLYVYMIVGFPTETEEEAINSFNLMKKKVIEKQVKSLIYNAFEIHPFSDVWANPDKYGITEILYPPNKDMYPPVASGFSAPGLSRKRLIELTKQFISELRSLAIN